MHSSKKQHTSFSWVHEGICPSTHTYELEPHSRFVPKFASRQSQEQNIKHRKGTKAESLNQNLNENARKGQKRVPGKT